MNFFNFFSKKNNPPAEELLTLEKLVELDFISKEEMLKIKKDRAIKEWENEAQPTQRSHHKRHEENS